MKKPKFCVYCGFKLRDDDFYCPNCGVKIEAEKWYGSSSSLSSYKRSLDDLKKKYESKESEALELVNKRFAPPQITYNKLINELIISSKDSKKSDDEIQNLFKDMDDLIDSVKKYE